MHRDLASFSLVKKTSGKVKASLVGVLDCRTPTLQVPLVLEHFAASIWSCMVPFLGHGFITCARQATHVTFRARYVQSDRGPLRLAKQKEKLQYVDHAQTQPTLTRVQKTIIL